MSTVPSILKSKLVWAVAIVLGLVGLYALLGFKVAPRMVRNQAIEYVRDTYHRELKIGEVRVHPFKLQLEARDVAIPDADGGPLVGFRRLFVDFELASLWERAFVFKDVEIDAPHVRAVVRPDGALNLVELVPPEDPNEPESPPPALWLQSFRLIDGVVDFEHRARRVPYVRRFTPVEFELKDFRTSPEGGEFDLTARSRNDEKLAWRGRFALQPRIASQGRFDVQDLLVTNVAELLGDALPFGMSRGQIDLAGNYDLALGDVLEMTMSLPKIEAAGVGLRARTVDEDWVEIPSVVLEDTKLALPARAVDLGTLTAAGLKIRLWDEPDGSTNIEQLFASSPEAAAATATPAEPEVRATQTEAPVPKANEAPAAESQDEWTVTLRTLALRDADIVYEHRAVKPTARFAFAPLNATFRDVSLDLAKPLPIELDTAVNETAKLTGHGQLVPYPFALDSDVEVARFELKDLQPYFNAETDLTIRGGTVGGTGKFAMAPEGSGKPELSFTGDARLDRFRSIDNALEQDFFNFERVDLRKLHYAMAPDALKIDQVRVVEPFARVIISSEAVLNVAAVFDPEGTAAAAAKAKAEAAAKEADSKRKQSRAEAKAEKKAAQAAAKARAAAPPPTLKETGMPIRVREVTVQRGTMDFADFSVQPNFAAKVESLEGSATGLSTDPNAHAKVKLDGNVGEFSPVHIEGTVQPFAYDRHTDIGMKFENISLPIFNPYSGKFAGYSIAKGKLTTDLHYTIDARKLNAQHKIRIEQLEWGEATAQKGEATLPVKFATSLLKDANGVINLDVPVSGTLDDPRFRVGPIVWQIVKNLLNKVVTAPFKALGALFKGAEEAQFVDFAPGMATLEPAAAERLSALGKSLAPKADLRLEIPIGADPKLDGEAVAKARYDRELAAAMTEALPGRKKASDADAATLPSLDTLEPDRQQHVLAALYQRLSGQPPSIPKPPEPAEGQSRKEAAAAAQQASLDYLEQETRKLAVAPPGELDKLAQQRGEAIQHAVAADTGFDPQRVFLTRSGKVTANGSQVRFELAVK